MEHTKRILATALMMATLTAPAMATETSSESIRVSSYKGSTLEVGERSGLIICPSGTEHTVTSSNPDIVAVERVLTFWVSVARVEGTAEITVSNSAQRTVNNWINSPDHFRTMIDPRCDCIGVGVTQYDGITYCYMFVGIPNSVNFYAYLALKEEVKEAEQIRRSVYSILRQAQQEQQPRRNQDKEL